MAYSYYSNQQNPELDHNLETITLAVDRGPTFGGRSSMTFEYYGDDRVSRHTNALGETTLFRYAINQRRTWVTHPDGSTTEHAYDRHANLIREISGEGVVRRYAYHPVTADRIEEVDGLGHVTTAQYDGRGNMTERVDRRGEVETWRYNPFGQVTEHVDRRGTRWEWSYDGRGNLLGEYVEIDGALVVLAEHEHDGFGNRVETVEYATPGKGRPSRTRFEYDADGVALVRVTDALGSATRFTHDGAHRPTRTETERTRTDNGLRETVVAEVSYDALDRIETAKDPAGLVQEITYDADGLVTRERSLEPDPQSPTGTCDPDASPPPARPCHRDDVERIYDAAHRLRESTDALGHTTTFEYDAMGRVVRTVTPLGYETQNFYDADGNRVRMIDPVGAVWRWAYDPEGRVRRATDPLGYAVESLYDAEGNRIEQIEKGTGPGGADRTLLQVQVDPTGLPTLVTDAAGVATEILYDALGRRETVTAAKGLAEEAVTTFAYDLAGRLTTRTDPNQNATHLGYDVLDRLVSVEDPVGRRTTHRYDEVGNRIETTNDAGDRIDRHFDARGLLTKRVGTRVGEPTAKTDDVFGYDARGRQVLAQSKVTNGAIRTFAYDALDRAVSVSDLLAGDPGFGTARRVFDADGRVVQLVHPTLAFPQGVVTNYVYDGRNQLTAILDPEAGAWLFAYDAAGRLARRSDAAGFEQTLSYTPEQFVDRVELVAADGTLVDAVDYDGHDALGNPAAIVRGATSPTTTHVGYDALSRVTEVRYPGGGTFVDPCTTECERFAYDAAGRRTDHTRRTAGGGVEAVDYLWSDADELTAVTADGDPATVLESFTYDGFGRRLTRAAGGQTTNYRYDALGRLRSIQRPGEVAALLSWGALGDRTRRVDTWGTTRRYFGGWAEIPLDQEPIRLLRGPGGVLAEVQAAGAGHETRRLYGDGRANVGRVATTADDGSPATLEPPRLYEAFGARRDTTLSAVERGFAGGRVESVSGLVHLGARHYDPATGTFLQPDPLYLETGERTSYGRQNPYRFVDPTGLGAQGINETQTLASDSIAADRSSPTVATLGSIASAVGVRFGEDVSVATTIGDAAGLLANIPGLNVVATGVEVSARLYEGDGWGALSASIGFIPGGKLVSNVGRLGVRATRAGSRAPASVDELVGMMNKRPGTVAEYATGDSAAYLKHIGAEGSHTLLEGGRSHILLQKDLATRRTALHEWLHGSLQRKTGGPRPGEDAFIESFLDRHKSLFRLDD